MLNRGVSRFITGVGGANTPSSRLCGSARPATRRACALCRHHGDAETGAYLLSGRARLYFGDGLTDHIDINAGDFMFVPPFLVHLEAKMSTTAPVWWIARRSPQNIIVNLPDVEDAGLAGHRRS